MTFMMNMTLVYFELGFHVCFRAIWYPFHRPLPQKQPQCGIEHSMAAWSMGIRASLMTLGTESKPSPGLE